MQEINKENNYAFIDSQNLNLGIHKLGWKLDYFKFRVYLREKYNVSKAYVFIGYMFSNIKLYNRLREVGFTICFKPTMSDSEGKFKGNVDTDIVLQAMIKFNDYNKAVIISSDGDFYSLVTYLYEKNKLEIVLSPNIEGCSGLLKQNAKEKIHFMDELKDKLEYIRKAPLEDETSRSAFP